ncbi:unnamed protein product [Acanthoscelides obtectus]|uniref:Uncharacterized protein n=1 Tax=Acanthoscelides obtectus TaxID=200917 RepID=A0A9P0NUE9_ACAOB|nr:unnamed protein product [Acanthoscelides obtectus]CAK1661979.1 hypothetical protein AOBTE_LOCUS22913 [Acanthoscelides obtectus]
MPRCKRNLVSGGGELTRKRSSTPYRGPEPASEVLKNKTRNQVKEWVRNHHKEHWTGCKHGKE